MINWKTTELEHKPWAHQHEYLNGVSRVKVNDVNEEWCHNDGTWTTRNSEIWVEKNKPTLLVTLGESWTYGEGTEVINHRHHKWQVRDRVEVTYSGKMARYLDSDLWTFARPGNSNTGIFAGLFRILANIPRGQYSSVKVLLQMTGCDRDRIDLMPTNHPLLKVIDPKYRYADNQKIELKDWFPLYDETLFGMLHDEIEKNKDLNLDVVVFKNFNRIWTDRRDYNFRIIEPSWIKFNAAFHGIELTECHVMHPNFYSTNLRSLNLIKNLDRDFINRDLDLWEKLVDFLKTNNDTNQADHPNFSNHILWTKNLIDRTGW